MGHTVEYLTDYISNFQEACDKYLTGICDPEGKSVLVLGCGWGTEMLWALRHRAAVVDGYDMAERNSDALAAAAANYRVADAKFSIKTVPAEKLRPESPYDIVLSFNAFEHISDVKGALQTCKASVGRKAGRICIFSAPLFYSAGGHHFPKAIDPWWHVENEEMPPKLNGWQQREFRGLNRITYRGFLDHVADAGLVLLRSFTVPDPKWPSVSKVKSQMTPFDLTLMGFGVELAVP